MSAAAITPTVVQKTYIPATAVTGTPVRLVEYFVIFTKVTASDWIVAATYCPGTYLGCSSWTIDSSGDGAIDVVTYTASGTLLAFTSSNVGTVYAKVLVQES